MSPIPGPTIRRVLFWAHLTCGVAAGLLILLMSVTGVLLAYERQVIDSAARRNRIDPAPAAARLDADTLAGIARGRLPAGARVNLVFDVDPAQPVSAQAGREASVLLHPYSGAVIDDAAKSWRGFFRTVENWHRWMGGEPRSTRANLMDLANLLFLFIACSGIYLWLPAVWKWRTLRGLMLFRTRYVNAKVRDFNWHHVFSFWMLVPLLLIALSGVVISYGWASNLVYAAFGETAPQRGGPPGAAGPGGSGGPGGAMREPRPSPTNADASRASLQSMLAVAAGQVTNWQRITIGRRSMDKWISQSNRGLPVRPPRQTLTRTRDASDSSDSPPNGAQGADTDNARVWFRFVHTGEQWPHRPDAGATRRWPQLPAHPGCPRGAWSRLASTATRRLGRWTYGAFETRGSFSAGPG
jgi:hypothetical protein